MMVRAGTGWQYALADLSLILFMVTASALVHVAAKAGDAPPLNAQGAPERMSQRIAAAMDSSPVAVWSAEPGAPPLADWLARAAADPRLEVRVIVRFSGDTREAAVARGLRLVEAGGVRAGSARLLVEPGQSDGASVSLFYARERTGQAADLAR